MAIIKLLMLARYIISKSVLFISLILKAIFKIVLFRPLMKLYYLIFRLKKSGVVESSMERTVRKNMGYFLVFSLLLAVTAVNIFTKKTNSDTNRLSRTVAASLIKNEFSYINEEILITEKGPAGNDIAANNYFDSWRAMKKPLESWKEEDEETMDNWLAMSIIKDGGAVYGTKYISLAQPATNSLSGQTASTKRDSIITYTVVSGDTISSIAKKFGININTILWSNNLTAYSLIRPGNSLTILPVSGWIYKVKSGDTLGKLASAYGISADEIIAANGIDSSSIKIGQSLIIPGNKPSSAYVSSSATRSNSGNIPAQASGGSQPGKASSDAGGFMVWPTVGHRITQYYSLKHTGLDIANKTGTPIYAVESGSVIYSGWSSGYGYNVVIDHGNGYKTRYAHSSKLEVSVGNKVKRGQEIMKMGSTGWSTGPHLHFEVIVNGVKKNPLNYIK